WSAGWNVYFKCDLAATILRVVRLRDRPAVWQLPERVHLASAGAPVHCEAALALRGVRPFHPLVRQSARPELGAAARPLPRLRCSDLLAISGGRVGGWPVVLDCCGLFVLGG